MLKINLRSNTQYIFFLLGLFSTCSCVALVGMGRVISLYSITLIIAFFILIHSKKVCFDILKSRTSKFFFIWSLSGLLSSAFGIIFFVEQDQWIKSIISGITKIILYFLFFCFLVKSNKRSEYSLYLLMGLMAGVIINIVWASVDAIVYYVCRISITNELFRSYILATDAKYGMLSLIMGGGVIRAGGLNGDPANIGMFAPILASYSLYSRKYWLYILVILGILSSVSIVGLISTVVISLIYLISKGKILIGGFILTIIIIGGVYLMNSKVDSVSGQMINAVIERLEEKNDSDDQSSNARSIYWLKFLPAAINSPNTIVIGTGYNTASYAYLNGGFLDSLHFPNIPYDPEQTYLSFYFDVGFIGFFAFLLLHINILRTSYKKRENNAYLMLFSGMEGIMISFLGYHYTLYSVSMLFLIAGIIIMSTEKSSEFQLNKKITI